MTTQGFTVNPNDGQDVKQNPNILSMILLWYDNKRIDNGTTQIKRSIHIDLE